MFTFGGTLDAGTGEARSAAFFLPYGIELAVWSRAGGADNSLGGFRIKVSADDEVARYDDEVLCNGPDDDDGGTNTNNFYEVECNLAAHEGKKVYILIEDKHTEGWGKVWVANITFQNEAGGLLLREFTTRCALCALAHIA